MDSKLLVWGGVAMAVTRFATEFEVEIQFEDSFWWAASSRK
jgi:hypothetical protein